MLEKKSRLPTEIVESRDFTGSARRDSNHNPILQILKRRGFHPLLVYVNIIVHIFFMFKSVITHLLRLMLIMRCETIHKYNQQFNFLYNSQ